MESVSQVTTAYPVNTPLLRLKNLSRPRYMLLAAGICLAVVLYLDAFYFVYHDLRPTNSFWVRLSRQITAEEFPGMSVLYVLRILLLLTCSALIIRSVLLLSKNKWRKSISALPNAVSDCATSIFLQSTQNFVLAIVTSLSVFFIILFVTDPVAFNSLCLEDHAVETYSDVLQFLNCGLFVYIWILIRRSNLPGKGFYQSVAALFVLFFFLCAGEEVSWFQRVFDIKTPEAFSSNIQNEMNLHNFATHPLENIYYFISFAFLVFVPYVKERTTLLNRSRLVQFYTPDSLVMLFSVPFVAYNYLNLNVFAAQLSVGMTLIVLLDLLRTRYRERKGVGWITVMFLLFVVSQVLFLVFGKRMVRSFDQKEYKEMLIPLSYLVFTVGVLKKVKAAKSATAEATKPLGEIRVVQRPSRQEAV